MMFTLCSSARSDTFGRVITYEISLLVISADTFTLKDFCVNQTNSVELKIHL